MKKCKSLICVVLIFVICFSFCSCSSSDKDSSSKNKFAGTWVDSRDDGENYYYYEIVLKSDGTYSEVGYKNDKLIDSKEGKYETDDNSVTLTLSPTTSITYKYKDGKLCNGDFEYAKK